MKFKVYKEKEEAIEKEVYFKLIEDGLGIKLVACNSKGREIFDGNILRITTSGELSLYNYINPEIGLQLDSKGQIVIEKDKK